MHPFPVSCPRLRRTVWAAIVFSACGSAPSQDVVLPDGTLVESGMAFRNGFHLSHLSRGDFFIPWCAGGARPCGSGCGWWPGVCLGWGGGGRVSVAC
jgi:hypothetical protein